MPIISFDNSKKGIFKNATIGFVFQFIIKFKGIIILPLIVHFLSKDVLGEWRLISTTVGIIVPIITLNILDGSGMFFSFDTDKRRVRIKYYTVFNFTLILTISFVFIAYLFRTYVELFDKYAFALILYFISLVLIKLSIFLLQTYQKSVKLLKINFVVQYGSALFTLILIFLNIKNVYALLIPILSFNIVTSFFVLLRVFQEIKYDFILNKKFIQRVLPVSIPLIPVFITEWILSSIGIYFLKYYFSLGVVGSYSVLLSIASLLLTLRATLQFFWFSTCSNLLRSKEEKKFESIFKETVKIYFIFGFMALIFYNFFAKDLINILANKNYLIIEKPLFYTAFGYVFLILSTIWNGILYALGKSKKILISYIYTALSVIILSFLLIKKFEIMGASIAYMIGNFVLFVSLFLHAKDIKLKFSQKEKIINITLIVILILMSIFRLVNVSQYYNRIIGIILIALASVLLLSTNYIRPYAIIKLFKK